jgi:hypothetical protein
MAVDQVDVLLMVVSALGKLGIPYLIGGSYASSAHGIARATMDIDFLAAIELKQASGLARELGDDFYADEGAIKRAIEQRRSFNVVHLESLVKVDVFPAQSGGFHQAQLERRQLEVIRRDPERSVYVASPEDIILAKLDWYRRGNEASDQQWRDVIGVVKTQAGRLDVQYLTHWARELNVGDLLDRALEEA